MAGTIETFPFSNRNIIKKNHHGRLLFQRFHTNQSVFRVSQCSAFDLVQFWRKIISRFRTPKKLHFLFSKNHLSALLINETLLSLSYSFLIFSHSFVRYVLNFTMKKLFLSRFHSILMILSIRFLPTVNLIISHPYCIVTI